MSTIETLPVIFRAERNKGADVTAVFPTLPHDTQGRYFTIYAHVGQHGAGGFDWYRGTRAAKPEEYADLLRELRGIYGRSLAPGDPVFALLVYKRMNAQHRAAFAAEVQRTNRRDRALAARERGESVPLGSIRPLPDSVRELARSRPAFA